MLCFRVLTDYLHLLEDWKVWYAPKTPDDALDDRFVEACQMIDYIEYLADILTVGDLEERVAVVDELMKNGKITFLQDYTTRKKKEDMETQMKKYKKFFKTADGKQKALEKKNDELTAALEKSEKESTVKKLQEMRLHSDYERIKGILDRIPPEIIRAYTHRDSKTQEVRHYR